MHLNTEEEAKKTKYVHDELNKTTPWQAKQSQYNGKRRQENLVDVRRGEICQKFFRNLIFEFRGMVRYVFRHTCNYNERLWPKVSFLQVDKNWRKSSCFAHSNSHETKREKSVADSQRIILLASLQFWKFEVYMLSCVPSCRKHSKAIYVVNIYKAKLKSQPFFNFPKDIARNLPDAPFAAPIKPPFSISLGLLSSPLPHCWLIYLPCLVCCIIRRFFPP